MTFHARLSDYCKLLGVDEAASAEEIRRAFWLRAKQYHPDYNRSPAATNAFIALSEAYQALRHAQRRQTFDAFLRRNMLLAPPPRTKPRWAWAWAAGGGLAVIVALGFLFTDFQPISPVTEMEATGTADAGASASAALSADVWASADPIPLPASVAPRALTSEPATPDIATGDRSPSPDVDSSTGAMPPTRGVSASAKAPEAEPKAPEAEPKANGNKAAAPQPASTAAQPASTATPIAPFPKLDTWEATVSRAPLPPLRAPGVAEDKPATLALRPDLAVGTSPAPAIEPDREQGLKKRARKHKRAKDRDKDSESASVEKRHRSKRHARDEASD